MRSMGRLFYMLMGAMLLSSVSMSALAENNAAPYEDICLNALTGNISNKSFEACSIEANLGKRYAREFIYGIASAQIEHDYLSIDKAFSWFKEAAKRKDMNATYDLAFLLLKDSPVEHNRILAENLLFEAARMGLIKAYTALGFLYDAGFAAMGKPQFQDFRLARVLYEKAALNGDPVAMYNLGVLNRDGRGIKPNRNNSILWFQKAKENGLSEARKIFNSQKNVLCPFIDRWKLQKCSFEKLNRIYF